MVKTIIFKPLYLKCLHITSWKKGHKLPHAKKLSLASNKRINNGNYCSADQELWPPIVIVFNWRISVLFMGPLMPLFWSPDDVYSGFQIRVSHLLVCYGFVTFTSDATPAYLLMASMTANPFSWISWIVPVYYSLGILGKYNNAYLSHKCLMPLRQNSVPPKIFCE